MAFHRICDVEEVWEGEMKSFDTDRGKVLLVFPEGGEIVAIQSYCPHQGIPLREGEFNGRVLVCRAHHWEFDPASGLGVNPSDARLKRFRSKIEGESVFVDLEDTY